MFSLIVLAAIAGSILGGCGSGASAGSQSPADIAKGKQMFRQYCWTCHTAGVSLQTFAKTVNFIKHPKAPMPNFYPKPLSEKDVEDIAAYLHTV